MGKRLGPRCGARPLILWRVGGVGPEARRGGLRQCSGPSPEQWPVRRRLTHNWDMGEAIGSVEDGKDLPRVSKLSCCRERAVDEHSLRSRRRRQGNSHVGARGRL